MIIPNLLLIAGTGNKSGKTTFACKVIEQFSYTGIVGIKITPHFHETTAGLNLMAVAQGYSIYEETDPGTQKDTSRMLRAGASHIYFAKVTDYDLTKAFTEIIKVIPTGIPVVCESPSLRYFVDPGLFIIMKSYSEYNNKDINKLIRLPHVLIQLDTLRGLNTLPLSFTGGKWSWQG